jgi:hypothetical protein
MAGGSTGRGGAGGMSVLSATISACKDQCNVLHAACPDTYPYDNCFADCWMTASAADAQHRCVEEYYAKVHCVALLTQEQLFCASGSGPPTAKDPTVCAKEVAASDACLYP